MDDAGFSRAVGFSRARVGVSFSALRSACVKPRSRLASPGNN
jgi:hypothetical protein